MKKNLLGLLAFASALAATSAHAAVDAAIDTAITDQGTVFTDVKTYVIGVVVFLNVIAVIKMLRKK